MYDVSVCLTDVLISTDVFLIMFGLTWGALPWLYQAEIFPSSIRAKANALATLSNWSWNAIISKSAPLLLEAMSEKMYILLAALCFGMGAFAFFFVPEKQGRSLEEMDDVFQDQPKSNKSIPSN